MPVRKHLIRFAGTLAFFSLLVPSVYASPALAASWPETVGGDTNTWTDPSNAGGEQGLTIPAYSTVEIECSLQGFAVADGNTWWYRIASAPWNGSFYASADAFYNNGATNGSLANTPFVDPVVPNCGSGLEPPQPPAPPQPPSPPDSPQPPPTDGHYIINGIDVGVPQNSPHEWGVGCIVQDFNGGPFGWVIVGYSHGPQIVRNGMLWGWLDAGGGPGLGCPLNQETAYRDGVRQDFENTNVKEYGYDVVSRLFWRAGFDHAQLLAARLDPCLERYPSGSSSTVETWYGSVTTYDQEASLFQVCEGFGTQESIMTAAQKCAVIAAGATFLSGPVGSIAVVCTTIDVLHAFETGDWIGLGKSVVCGKFAPIFAGAVAIIVAGAAVETGPGAAAIGLATYRALAGGLTLVCGGLLNGAIGAQWEADHEAHVAADVTRLGQCIELRNIFGVYSWSAVTCRS